MRKTKQIIAILIILCMVMAFIPFKVFAQGRNLTIDFKDGTVSRNTVSFSIGESTVSVTVNEKYTIAENNTMTIDEENWLSAFTFSDNFKADTMQIKIYTTDGFQAYYILNEDGKLSRNEEGGVPDSFYFVIEAKQTNQPENPEPPIPGESEFNGTAWFIWNDNDYICKYKVENLQGAVDKEFPINYIKESDVVDGTKKLKISNLSDEDYYWIFSDKIEELNAKNFSSWKELKDSFESDENIKRSFAINPCEAENGANTIATNGDGIFRAIIYSDEFEGLTFGTNETDYKYFPDFWDPIFFNSTIDISNTTKANPAVYETYLLEPTIKFNTSSNSKSTIKSIKALDVNSGAVVITNKGNGDYEITFKSNYYDKVIFELTAEDGNVYYVKIARTVLQVCDNFGPETPESDEKITASLYYSDEYSYNDFKVLANINYSDGTKATKMLSVSQMNDGSYEKDGGKGLKFSEFVIKVDKEIKTIDYTVIYDGALDGDTYGGTFAGSGKGTTYDVNAREIIYK